MALLAAQELHTDRPRLSLDGAWQFAYDPADQGRAEGWFRPEHRLPERLRIPGCSQARRYRSAPAPGTAYEGLPELDAQVLLRYPCRAPSWYKRRFRLPAAWRGQRVWLHLGGVKPAATLWLNGAAVGRTTSSRTPVRCDITEHVRFGTANDITLRLDWAPGCFHGLFDILSGWSGLYRSAWVEAVPALHLANVQVVPHLAPPHAQLTVTLNSGGAALPEGTCRVAVDIRPAGGGRGRWRGAAACELRNGVLQAQVRVPLPGARWWSPDAPHLHIAGINLEMDGRRLDGARVRFGLREVRTRGFQVLLNGKPVFLRGGCDDQHYPRTVCPPADTAFYLKRLRRARQWGFNYTKSCVEIFTPEFLDAADEVGLLVCEEMPLLVRDGMGRTPDHVLQAGTMRDEVANIVRADRCHPSVILYSMSSELSTAWHTSAPWFRFLSQELPALTRQLNPAALVIDATGTSTEPNLGEHAVPVDTPHGRRDTDLDGSWLLWNSTARPLAGPIPGLDTVTRPFIFHEFAWITALSDPRVTRRFARLPLKPLHVAEMVAAAQANGQGALLPHMLAASRQLKYALRKQAFELARQEVKAAGYHHWLIHDFPFCAEGVFNEFWEEPADLTAAEFRACNDDTVLCLDHGPRWSFRWGEAPALAVRISHFGPATWVRGALRWRWCCGRTVLAQGEDALVGALKPGTLCKVPLKGVRLPTRSLPARLELHAELRVGRRRVAANHWPLWVFPETVPGTPCGPRAAKVLVCQSLTGDLLQQLASGARVLFLNPGASEPQTGDLPRAPGEPLYRSVPFNCGTTGNTGTLVTPHPALGAFPHPGWCDFAWVEMVDGAQPFDLAKLGVRVAPIIRSIGHLRTMHDKAYLFELAVGRGRLLACSLRLNEATLAGDPAAPWLLANLRQYLAGPLAPSAARVTPARLRAAAGLERSD